jgi:hypothetical protein
VPAAALPAVASSCLTDPSASLPKVRQETALITAMGFEVANIHLGSGTIGKVRGHLESNGPHWLAEAKETMAHAIHGAFRQSQHRPSAS